MDNEEESGGEAYVVSGRRGCSFSLAEWIVGAFVLGIVAAIAIPNFLECRCGGCETAAQGHLMTIAKAQEEFRLKDSEGDGLRDFGSLEELGRAKLISSVLATGTQNHYLFECTYSATTSEFLWFARARHEDERRSQGHPSFVINHEGVVFYTLSEPYVPTQHVPVNRADGSLPPGLRMRRR